MNILAELGSLQLQNKLQKAYKLKQCISLQSNKDIKILYNEHMQILKYLIKIKEELAIEQELMKCWNNQNKNINTDQYKQQQISKVISKRTQMLNQLVKKQMRKHKDQIKTIFQGHQKSLKEILDIILSKLRQQKDKIKEQSSKQKDSIMVIQQQKNPPPDPSNIYENDQIEEAAIGVQNKQEVQIYNDQTLYDNLKSFFLTIVYSTKNIIKQQIHLCKEVSNANGSPVNFEGGHSMISQAQQMQQQVNSPSKK